MRLRPLAFGFALYCVATSAFAQSATNMSLAITSGGSAVTVVQEESEVTLAATVIAGSAPVTRGQVNFCIAAPPPLKCTDIRLLGTAQLTSAGTAVFSFYPPAGNHTYQAEFVGTGSDAPSSASGTLLVSPFDPTLTTITAANFLGYGTYTFDVLVTSSAGTVSPTGTVSILDTSNANYVLATAPLVPVSGAGSGGSSGFSDPPLTSTVPCNPGITCQSVYAAVADFNGDGIKDLAVGNISTNNVWVALGTGSGTFTIASSPPVGNAPISIAVADFTGDGKPGLAVASFGKIVTEPAVNASYFLDPILAGSSTPGSVSILEGNGDGTFAAATTLPASMAPASVFVATGDFNGDGIPDLAVANANFSVSPAVSSVNILLGSGDGTFTLKSTFVTGNNPLGITVGDFNNDGFQDLAVVNTNDNTITVLLGKGDGSFKQLAAIPSTGFSSDPTAITTADFNGDGNLDLAVVNYGNPSFGNFNPAGSIWVMLGRGDGTFTPQTEMIGRNHLTSIAVGDFNADGKPDLVVSDFAGLPEVMLGNGDGTFGPQKNPLTISTAGAVAVADFNGDGITDIAIPTLPAPLIQFPPPYPPPAPPPSYVEVLIAETGQQTGTTSAAATVGPFFVVGTGYHGLMASYSGDINYLGSVSGSQPLTGTELVTAEPEPTTLSFTASPASINYGQPATLTAVVAPITAQNHSATGSVTFTYGNTVVGTSTTVGSVATFTTAMLPSGVDRLTATYSGDTNFAVSTGTATETVNGSQTVTTLAIAPNPALVGQTVTLAATVTGVSFPQTPTGSVTFYSGTTALAQVPLTTTGTATYSTVSFPFGSYVITAIYSGDPAFYPSTSTPTTLVISGYLSATTLTAAPNPAGTGQTVTLTAGVIGIGSSTIAAGTVKFFDGTTPLGTGTLDPTGHATLATTTLTLGTHSLTAIYSGSSSYSTSTSPAYSEVIQNPAFTISLSYPIITLAKYQHTTTSVTLASSGNFSDTITLTCTNPPANLSCIFTPTPAPLAANSTATVSFYLDTDSILGGNFAGPLSRASTTPTSITLALLLPFTLFAVRLRKPRAALLPLFLTLTALPLALTGCGSSVITPVPGTLPGTYALTITGTGATTGITHSTQLTLVVTP